MQACKAFIWQKCRSVDHRNDYASVILVNNMELKCGVNASIIKSVLCRHVRAKGPRLTLFRITMLQLVHRLPVGIVWLKHKVSEQQTELRCPREQNQAALRKEVQSDWKPKATLKELHTSKELSLSVGIPHKYSSSMQAWGSIRDYWSTLSQHEFLLMVWTNIYEFPFSSHLSTTGTYDALPLLIITNRYCMYSFNQRWN